MLRDEIERARDRARCAASSPTPRTSCARRSPPSAPTPSCSRAAPTGAPTTSRARWPGSGASRERMSVLVEDLLLLARLDEGRPLEREPVELDEVVGRGRRDRAGASSPSGRSSSTPSPPSCSATATGCARSSTTCSRTSARTRPPARPRASRVARENGDARDRGRATPGPGIDAEAASSASSSASTAPTRRGRGRAAASGSASRSSPRSRRRTAAASRRRSEPGEGTTFRIVLPLDGEHSG